MRATGLLGATTVQVPYFFEMLHICVFFYDLCEDETTWSLFIGFASSRFEMLAIYLIQCYNVKLIWPLIFIDMEADDAIFKHTRKMEVFYGRLRILVSF